MDKRAGRLVFDASDLARFFACRHLTRLSREVAEGRRKAPPPADSRGRPPGAARGRQRAEVAKRFPGLKAVPAGPGGAPAAERTLRLLRQGPTAVCEGWIEAGGWRGRPDFLLRVDRPSRLGDWSYEALEVEASRRPSAAAVLRLAVVSRVLGEVQGRDPRSMHVALGEGRIEALRVTDFAAFERRARTGLERFFAVSPKTGPEPVAHCRSCAWDPFCRRQRAREDHLSRVAGITAGQRRRLAAKGVRTLTALARLELRPPGRHEPDAAWNAEPVGEPGGADADLEVGVPEVPRRRGRLDGAEEARIPGISRAALLRIHHQARVQLQARAAGAPRHELLGSSRDPARAEGDPRPGFGLLRLPRPSTGDRYFAIERTPFAVPGGLHYLFGQAGRRTGRQAATRSGHAARWALDPRAERRAFQAFMDAVRAARARDPNLHLYCFGADQTGALARLAGRHDTRGEELDDLLRGSVLVDLRQIVRQGVRASVEAYRLRELEPFFSTRARAVDPAAAERARAGIEAALAAGKAGGADREAVEADNRDTCRALAGLHRWLLRERKALVAEVGERSRAAPGRRKRAGRRDGAARTAAFARALVRGLPEDRKTWSAAEGARRVLADVLDYHRREEKSVWWEYFARQEMDETERIADRRALGGLEFDGAVGHAGLSPRHRYRFDPNQAHEVRLRTRPLDPRTGEPAGQVVELDDEAGTLVLEREPWLALRPHPQSLIPFTLVGAGVLRDAVLDVAARAGRFGFREDDAFSASWDLLLRRPPRLRRRKAKPGESLERPNETTLDAARRLAVALDYSVLAVQGPPGTGKTWTGARMIVALVEAGHRVGVTAQSHKVIRHLLEAVAETAGADAETGRLGWLAGRILQKTSRPPPGGPMLERSDGALVSVIAIGAGPGAGHDPEQWRDPIHAVMGARKAERLALPETPGKSYDVIGGTAWFWARPAMRRMVDVLFIEEAGQFSLVNALAVARAAGSLVLLGDPRQLDQVTAATHPPGAGASALGHFLGDGTTLPPDRGLFLADTWRMHPDISRFHSEQFYEDRLGSRPGLERQRIECLGPLTGAGLRFVPVRHEGNRTWSREEVDKVAMLVFGLLAGAWTDRRGKRRRLEMEDILVISPYNNQVEKLKRMLTRDIFPRGARVGTVDKFQGQEAPVVIYSMATSTPEDAPRGMEFLYSRNRFNVATSRARAVAAVVASPALLLPDCSTPGQMRLANALCRFVELAEEQTPARKPVT